MLNSHPLLSFMARGQQAAGKEKLNIFLNGKIAAYAPLTPEWKKYEIPLSPKLMGRLQGEEVEFKIQDSSLPCQISKINFSVIQEQ